MSNSTTAPDPLSALVESIAEKVCERNAENVRAIVEDVLREHVVAAPATPAPEWMDTTKAIEYSGLKRGTFEKHMASGRIPSHGGRSKIFKRDELDRALAAL